MYPQIPTILRSDELLDKALGRAAKISKEDKVPFYRVRKTVSAQLESIRDTLLDTLDRYLSTFPNLDKVSTYERELLDTVIGVKELRHSLGRVSGARDVIKSVLDEQLRNADRGRDVPGIKKAKSAAIGRASSIVEDLAEALRFLSHARDVMRRIPEVSPGDPTIVVAGYPNVGKSSLLARISRARPEIAPYPFTTKSANIGHFHWPESGPEHRRRRYQVVDTPGLLEKPPEKRNAIERQAVLALQYLADLIVYMLDPSEACGYDIGAQERLMAQVRQDLANVPLIVVENKADLRRTQSANLKISCETGDGIPALKARIVESVPLDRYEALLGGDPARS